MSNLNVYDKKGAVVGEIAVVDELQTGRKSKGVQAVHDAVVAHLAARRAGTASTLTKASVAGTGKKPWRQKGTGRARAGLKQSPVWRGGGVAHGPHPRDFSFKLNKKVVRLAFKRAFSDKLSAGMVKIVDDLNVAVPKTKAFMAVLKALDVHAPALFIVDKIEKNVLVASRNVPRVELVRAKDVSVYQMLRYPVVVISKAAMEDIRRRLEGKAEAV